MQHKVTKTDGETEVAYTITPSAVDGRIYTYQAVITYGKHGRRDVYIERRVGGCIDPVTLTRSTTMRGTPRGRWTKAQFEADVLTDLGEYIARDRFAKLISNAHDLAIAAQETASTLEAGPWTTETPIALAARAASKLRTALARTR